MLRDGELQSSGAQFRAELPKSGALSTIPKRSLNADVAQWVANGGHITVVQSKTIIEKVGRRDKEYVLAEKRAEVGEKSKGVIFETIKAKGPIRSLDVAGLVGQSRGTVIKHIQRLVKSGDLVAEKVGTTWLYEVSK